MVTLAMPRFEALVKTTVIRVPLNVSVAVLPRVADVRSLPLCIWLLDDKVHVPPQAMLPDVESTVCGVGVAVGAAGVGVLVGATGVFVGGTGVLVGVATGVLVGGGVEPVLAETDRSSGE